MRDRRRSQGGPSGAPGDGGAAAPPRFSQALRGAHRTPRRISFTAQAVCESRMPDMSRYIELHAASAFSFLAGRLAARGARRSRRRARLPGARAARPRRRLRRAALPQGGATAAGMQADHRRGADDGERAAAGGAAAPHDAGGRGPTWRPAGPRASRAEGYRNLCRLITRMKLARAERRRRADARGPRGARRAGLVALAGARGARSAGASASAASLDRLVGLFGRDQRLRRAAAALPPRRGGRQRHARRPGRGVPRAARRHGRRPLRRPRATGRCSTSSRASATTRRSAGAGRRLAPNAERYLKPPARDGGAVRRSARGGGATRRAGRPPAVHDGRSRLPLSRLSGAAGRDAGVVPAADHRGRRARALPAVSRPGARADRARARSDREARSRRLLPHRLGHRQLLPRSRTSSCRGAARRPTAPSATASASRRSIRSAWTCCSSASCPRSAASGRTSISTCRAAIGASA